MIVFLLYFFFSRMSYSHAGLQKFRVIETFRADRGQHRIRTILYGKEFCRVLMSF